MASGINDDSDEEMDVTEQDLFNNDSIITDLNRSEHENVVTQILWPRLLPSKESQDLAKHEAVLIALMKNTLESIEVTSKILPTSTSKLFRSMHNINTSNDAQCISSEINQLKCGEMLGVFVKHQNCGLVIYTLPEKNFEPRKAIVSTFPVSVPVNEINEQENSDFQIDFPTLSLKVEFSTMLNSLEFAKQLWHLSHNERKQADEEEIVATEDDISTTYVSKWLLPILSNCRSKTATLEEFPVISKKIRDDVVGVKSTDSKPFRRSTYWTFIKVILQLNLTLELGPVNGTVMYKLVMLKFIGIICNYYSTELYSILSIDKVSHLLAKMARRIEKMKDVSAQSNLNECLVGFQNVYNGTIDEVKLIISKVRQKIDHQINALQTNEETNSKLPPLNDLNFELDVYQRIPRFREHLKMLQVQPSDNNEGKLIVKSHPRLYLNSTKPPNVKVFKKLKNPEETGIFLCDFENWILFALDLENDVDRFDSKALRIWSFVYSSKAEQYYKGDQLGFSRIALTQLKILALLDKIAVEKHQLLKKHRPGININIFDDLLLAQCGDVHVANKLKEYFRKRSIGTLGPGLLEEKKLSEKSFSAIFAASDNDMKQVGQLIQSSIDNKKAEKKQEWKIRRAEMKHLNKQLESLECEYVKNSNGKREHSDSCAYCKINEKVRNCRVATFELPMPSEEYEKNAVLFELRIPVEIACLRDVLYEIVRLFNEPNVKKIIVHGNWIDCEEIESFNVSTSERVFMATTIKPVSRRNTRSRGIHVDSNFDDCIIQNARNCILYCSHAINYHIPIVTRSQSIKKFTTFTVELGSPYENLQWTLDGTSHTQNEVLARQCECPQSLTLSEYKNFGSLRADGYRLQLRNLYAVIETEGLSFETQSVQSLIMQLLWEKGPENESSDFSDPLFARAMIELIDKFIDTQKCNWKNPLKLLMTVLIAVRVFDMTDDDGLANRIVQLLVKLRGIANVSIAEVQYAMRGTENQEDIKTLRANLVEIAIAGAMTFFVHTHHDQFDKILSGDSTITAYRFWLEFLVTVNCNMLLTNTITKLPIMLNQQMFQRIVHRIGIQLESKIKEIIKNDPDDLFEFIKTQWPTSNDGAFELKLDEAYPQTIIVSVITPNNIEHFIQIDIITGEFLLNNLPVSRLPKIITKDPLFEKVFEQLIFEVYQESTNSFCAKYKYKNSHYSFHVNQGTVSITEIKKNGKEYKLIHPDVFEAEIPYLLVNNYSHWWIETEQIIEFRPIQFSSPNFSIPERLEYQLNLTNGTLMQMKTGKPMLDVTSESYQRIVSQLERLETAKYIHIFMDEPNVAKVELVRMNLKFIVEASEHKSTEYNVISNEFHGMKIISQQKCGTLYGLRQGLILGSIPSETTLHQSKLLILPHARIDAQKDRDHEIVKIDIVSELRIPTFYTYQIDELCHQLKASNSSYSAWFYLAYLHALTSHGQAEPLTEMSGTERALQILQSGFAWSSAPYDDEALATLKLIANLAPHRKYKNGIQIARWPDFVQKHAAQDSFLFVTQKLLTDSQRLSELHPKSEEGKKRNVSGNFHKDIDIDVSKLEVNKREYFRLLPFYPNLKLSNCFLEHEISVASRYVHYECDRNILSTRMLSNLYHQNTFKPPTMFKLSDYLTIGRDSLRIEDFDKDQEILDIFSMQDVRKLWIPLYNVARTGELSRGRLALILSLLAHEHTDVDFNAILALQTVAANQDLFISIEPPDVEMFDLADRSFNLNTIEVVLESCKTVRYSEMGNEDTMAMYDYIEKLIKIIASQWPCDRVLPNIFRHTQRNMNLRRAVKKINAKLRNWSNVQLLMDFFRKIDEQIQQLNSTVTKKIDVDTIVPWRAVQLPFKNLEKFHIDFDAKIGAHLSLFEDEVKAAGEIYNKICGSETGYTAQEWWRILTLITKPMEVQHLIDAGIYPRIVLTSMLPKLLSPTENPKLKAIIGAVAVKMVHEQRNCRINIYSQQPHMSDAYEREKENVPHTNWYPSEYPEWLLFEIEQNLTIRRIQIEIAMRMIDPPKIGTKHSIMQLNMGEGKTAVIVPILASVLANEKHVCQITVLKSLFSTNMKALRQCLGGILNRRVYTFPCRRDMPINKNIDEILNIYKECGQLKGVVLTLPEYQLSFQLKTYEAQIKNEIQCSDKSKMLQTYKWLNENVRNIFDESDAILHPKYQLIYTMGEQLSLDGGAQRWTIIQAVLNRLPHHLKKLWEDGDNKKIEFDYNHVKSGQVLGTGTMTLRSDVFTPCRILDYSIYKTLKSKLIDDFLCGRLNISVSGIGPSEKKILKLLLNERNASAATFSELIGKVATSQLTTILILSGLLRFDVLHNVMNKRWRVNYGVNKKGTRKMAVPFKAKDVAAEMTEFGHADVAICLTQLSYYYSGLSDAQLHQVFFTLGSQPNSANIYKGWIKDIPYQLVHKSIISYNGVNLSDSKQRNDLVFPLLRNNMYVIDYWLSNLVYPREAKTFKYKLMSTAWDLCSDRLTHTVSGFSGTNDTKNILPIPISQNDLKELERTNDDVRNILLRDENNGYDKLPANVRGMEILIRMSKLKIPVLLDSGACMLELSNEEVAQKWLTLVPVESFDSALYFSENNVLLTIDRNGFITEFDCSIYCNNLDRCLVYLDDTHTRGTDLKFPLKCKACVTISGDITRDKTVQACMRMRLLGKGHTIVFWASYEADIRIRELFTLGDATPTNKDVINFVCHNSQRFEEDNMIHWLSAAINYTKKETAHKLHNHSIIDDTSKMLYEKCVDNEFVTLEEIYGDKEDISLTKLSKSKFKKIVEDSGNNAGIIEFVKSIENGVLQKLDNEASILKRFIHTMDEEQEKELEHELEEERQVERPIPALPVTPVFETLLINVVKTGTTSPDFARIKRKQGIISFAASLSKKQLFKAYENYDQQAWAENLYVTRDFISVIDDSTKIETSDEYIRPPWWIARITNREGKDIIILLSAFETNHLLPIFRESNRSALYMFRPRLSQCHKNLLDEAALQVTGMERNDPIDLAEQVQVAVYAGSMYFHNNAEQNAYCGFLGLIPQPRDHELEKAFEDEIISSNGFVPPEYRCHSTAISRYVGQCKFQRNPVELAIMLIEAHHQFIRRESHVGSILQKSIKMNLNEMESKSNT